MNGRGPRVSSPLPTYIKNIMGINPELWNKKVMGSFPQGVADQLGCTTCDRWNPAATNSLVDMALTNEATQQTELRW